MVAYEGLREGDEPLRRGAGLLARFGETRTVIHRLVAGESERAEVALVSDPRNPPADHGARFGLARTGMGEAIASRAPVVVDPVSATTSPRWKEEPLDCCFQVARQVTHWVAIALHVAAAILGLKPSTLQGRMKMYGVAETRRLEKGEV